MYKSSLLALALGLAGSSAALAVDGLPDPLFGAEGRVILDAQSGTERNYGRRVRAIGGGSIVLVDVSDSPSRFIRVLRLDGAGQTLWSTDIDFGYDNEWGADLEVLPDGRILVLAGVQTSVSETALARLHAHGGLDGSFGSGGKITHPVGVTGSSADLVVLPNGKLVTIGTARMDASMTYSAFAMRLHANGTLDNGFAGGGIRSFTQDWIHGGSSTARAVAVDSNNNLLVAGDADTQTLNGPMRDGFVTRLDANGDIVSGFGLDGHARVTLDFGGSLRDSLSHLVIDAADRIWAGGSAATDQGERMLVVKLLGGGGFDGSFGQGGKFWLGCTSGVHDCLLAGMAFDESNLLVLAGTVEQVVNNVFDRDMVAMRKLPVGLQMDLGFGGNGIARVDLDPVTEGTDQATRMTIDSGRVLVVGTRSAESPGARAALLRLGSDRIFVDGMQ